MIDSSDWLRVENQHLRDIIKQKDIEISDLTIKNRLLMSKNEIISDNQLQEYLNSKQ